MFMLVTPNSRKILKIPPIMLLSNPIHFSHGLELGQGGFFFSTIAFVKFIASEQLQEISYTLFICGTHKACMRF